jgi:hypothetical protein
LAEEIRYNFTGDASDLQAAAQKAKEALQDVANAEKQVDTSANFDKQASSIQSLSNYYNILKNSVNAYSQALSMNSSYTSQFVSSLQSAQSTIAGFLPAVSSALGNLNVTFEGLTQGMMYQRMSTQQLAQAYVSLPTSIAGLIPASTSAVTALSTLSKTTNDVKNSVDFTQSSLNRFDSALSMNSAYTNQVVKAFQKGEGELVKLQQAYMKAQNAAKAHNNTSKQTVQTTNKATMGFNNLKSSLSSLPGQMSVVGASTSKLFSKLMQLVSLREIFGLFKKLINYSNDYIESMNLFVVSSTGYYESMKANADILSFYAGVTQTTIANAAGQFKLLATEMGVSSDKAAKMSNSLVNLAVDMSSLFNRDFEDVTVDLESGLQGMTRAVRKYGIDLTEAGIAETAAQLGIQKKTAAMSQAEKMQIRYIRILQQTNLAQTDFARTIQTPANMLKILKNQIKETAVTLGNLFYPILNTVLPALIKFTLVIQNIAKYLAKLFGIDTTKKLIDPSESKDLEKSTAAAASNMDDAASSSKKMKQQLQGFDELNNLTTSTSSGAGAGDTGTGGPISIDIPSYDNLLSLSNFLPNLRKQAADITNKFKEWFEPIKKAASVLKGPFKTAQSAVAQMFSDIGAKVATFIQQFTIDHGIPFIDSLLQTVTILAPAISEMTGYLLDYWKGLFGPVLDLVSALLPVFAKLLANILPPVMKMIANIGAKVATFIQQFTIDHGIPFIDSLLQTVTILAPAISEMTGYLLDYWKGLFGPVLDLVSALLPVFAKLLANILPPVMKMTANIGSLVGEIISLLGPILVPILDMLTPILTMIINSLSFTISILTKILSIGIKVIKVLLSPIIVLIQVLSSVFTQLGGVVNKVFSAMYNKIEWLYDKIAGFSVGIINAVSKVLNKVIGGIEWLINKALSLFNPLIKGLNKIPGVNIPELRVTIPKIPMYEFGGFPEDGLFFANHNELVGQFSNGSNAVVNNEQIIAGIEGGVERGMTKALGRNGTSRDVAQANIYIDGDLLFRKMIEYNNSYKRRTGKSAFA